MEKGEIFQVLQDESAANLTRLHNHYTFSVSRVMKPRVFRPAGLHIESSAIPADRYNVREKEK